MASLWKDPRSPYWTCCFTAADGRQLKRSTRETDKTKARVWCEQLEKIESLGRKGYLTSEEQFRRVVGDAIERITGRRRDEPTVREWLERWLLAEQGVVRPASLRRYRHAVALLFRFLGTRSDARLESLSTEDFLRLRDTLLSEGRSPQTVNYLVRKILKRPLSLAVQEGVLARNPVAPVRALHVERVTKGLFTPEHITRLLAVADTEWRGMILGGYLTGARLSDLSRLTWDNVDLTERVLTFVQQKTGAPIRIPIHPDLEDYLRSLPVPPERNAPLFPSLYDMNAVGRSGLSSTFRAIMRQAGIDPGAARKRLGRRGQTVSSLSFHSLRHSLVSTLTNLGVPSEVRKLVTGHADDATHGLYSHHQIATVRAAVEQIPRLAPKTI